MQNEKWQWMFEPESKRWKRRVNALTFWGMGVGVLIAIALLWLEGFQQDPFPMFYAFGCIQAFCGFALSTMVLKENFLVRWQVSVIQISWGIGMCFLILALFGIQPE
jgi:hypothetical protein